MSLKKTPVDVQAVFDAMDAFLAGIPGATAATASVFHDGSGVTHSVTANDQMNQNVSYSERNVATRVAISPVSATLHPGETQQFAASAVNPDNSPNTAPITWSLPVGAPGVIDASGLYTAPASIATATSTMVTAAQGQSWSSATVSLQPAI